MKNTKIIQIVCQGSRNDCQQLGLLLWQFKIVIYVDVQLTKQEEFKLK